MGHTPNERQKYIDELKAYAEEQRARERGHHAEKETTPVPKETRVNAQSYSKRVVIGSAIFAALVIVVASIVYELGGISEYSAFFRSIPWGIVGFILALIVGAIVMRFRKLGAYAKERRASVSGHQRPKQVGPKNVTDWFRNYLDRTQVVLLSLVAGGILVFAVVTGASYVSRLTPDQPQLTPDQVITVAKAYSPLCPSFRQWSTAGPQGEWVHTVPSYAVEYLGDGVWLITKVCSGNDTRYNGRWYFYESTGKLVEQ